MFPAGGSEDDVFGVAVVLHPSLVNLVNQSPAAGRGTLQHQIDIPIPKAISKEGREPCPYPAVDTNNECKLDSIALDHVAEVVLRPQS